MNNIKLYDKRSDKIRLADARVRIVKDSYSTEPCYDQDLVFEKADRKVDIPPDALMCWHFAPMDVWFFTTAERCGEMISNDPSFWTKEKLTMFAQHEKNLYQDWWDGRTYGFTLEKWDDAKREWVMLKSLYGYYGAKDIVACICDQLENVENGKIPVCLDKEDMKYDFDNAEKMPNTFE